MADYAATVVLKSGPNATPIAPGLSMVVGTLAVTNYNTSLLEIIGITKLFRTLHAVILESISDNGYLGTWIAASGAVKAWYSSEAHVHQQSITTGSTSVADESDGALIEDSAASETVVRAMGSAVDVTYDIGNTITSAAGPATEVASDVDVGLWHFTAFGRV